jgi:hypothetical protein
MQPSNRFAFKEWSAVCAALDAGRQTVILRKGGIHEGREGFRVEHAEFWLFPTRFHQAAAELVTEARPLLAHVEADRPGPGIIRLRNYAVVEETLRLEDERQLAALAGCHVLSERTVADRFQYRTPGLFVLVARIHRLPEPLDIPDSPHFAGCRSWVDLPDDLPTTELTPVLDDGEFRRRVTDLRRAIGAIAVV